MIAARRVGTTIERVPPKMIALLEVAGDLPALPEQCEVDQGVFGFRKPTLTEGAALTWLLAWAGPRTEHFADAKPSGILGYEDGYDFHTASDVRVVSYLAGSRRAVIDLLRQVLRESRADGRRLIGSVDAHNKPLARVLVALGAKPTRITFEADR